MFQIKLLLHHSWYGLEMPCSSYDTLCMIYIDTPCMKNNNLSLFPLRFLLSKVHSVSHVADQLFYVVCYSIETPPPHVSGFLGYLSLGMYTTQSGQSGQRNFKRGSVDLH